MSPRQARVSAAFPILLCEVEIGAASDAFIGSRRLPVRPAEPQTIAVIGDTGCRMVSWERQACHSGVEWPFSAVAVSLARLLKSTPSPSVILHVGDFHYREHPCADLDENCGGSPFGENWATWEEEFFKPASPLLLSGAWVVMRGNHETCTRAGAGWLFFFALPHQHYDGACVDRVLPYALTIGRAADGRRHLLEVFDTANSEDPFGYKERCKDYGRWVTSMSATADVWLALHTPLWYRAPKDEWRSEAVPRYPCREPHQPASALDKVRHLLGSPRPGVPSVSVVLSGDLHVFQVFDPRQQNLPVQLIVGNGGTALDNIARFPNVAKPHPDNSGLPEDTAKEELKVHGLEGDALTISRHGFVVLGREANHWSLDLHGTERRLIASCAALPTQTASNSGLSSCGVESGSERRN